MDTDYIVKCLKKENVFIKYLKSNYTATKALMIIICYSQDIPNNNWEQSLIDFKNRHPKFVNWLKNDTSKDITIEQRVTGYEEYKKLRIKFSLHKQ